LIHPEASLAQTWRTQGREKRCCRADLGSLPALDSSLHEASASSTDETISSETATGSSTLGNEWVVLPVTKVSKALRGIKKVRCYWRVSLRCSLRTSGQPPRRAEPLCPGRSEWRCSV